jgi:hypothetical protein
MHEYGLGLVVGIVAHSHDLGPNGSGKLPQKPVASPPGCFFDGQPVRCSQARHVGTLNRAGQTPIRRDGAHKLGIGTGLGAAETVVQVRYMQRQPILPLQAAEDVQQAEGIRPP